MELISIYTFYRIFNKQDCFQINFMRILDVQYFSIQLKYGYEGYRQFPLPRAQVYFLGK